MIGPSREEASAMVVRVEKSGSVTTVVLNRPEVRNAVDRATAVALAEAFRAFERDETALVGVLYGDHGQFCAGAAVAIGLANQVVPHGTARATAEQLARDLARFPQAALRGDRLSAWEQCGLPLGDALANEFRRGIGAAAEAVAGAARFASGAG